MQLSHLKHPIRLASLLIVALSLTLTVALVSAAPGPFNLTFPGNADVNNAPVLTDPAGLVTIQWEDAVDGVEYRFELTTPTGGSVVVSGLSDSELTVTAIETVLTEEGLYEWTVFAIDVDANETEANAPFFFIVDFAATPGAFALTFPGDADVNNAPTFTDPAGPLTIEWEDSAGAVEYRFELTTPTGGSVVVSGLSDSELPVAAIEAVLTEEGLYEWTVFAIDINDNETEANAPFFFIVDFTATPGAFALTFPGDPDVDNAPTFTDPTGPLTIEWGASNGAAEYRFELKFPDATVTTIPTTTNQLPVMAIEAVLTQNGLYEWTVFAIDANGNEVEADEPFFFNVVLTPQVQGFSLQFPPNNFVTRAELPDNLGVQWTESVGATDYLWTLFKLSGNPRVPIGLVASVSTDNSICDMGVCTLIVDASVLDTGTYAWTVVAENAVFEVEASNGPFFFSVNLDDIELLTNGGFEANNGVQPANWNRNGVTNDRIRCNNPNRTFTDFGNCAYQFRGQANKNARLIQVVQGSSIPAPVVGPGDELVASIFARSNRTTAGQGRIIVTVRYGSNIPATKQVVQLNVAAPNTWEQFTGAPISPTHPINNVRFVIRYTGTGGQMFVDNASLILRAYTPPANPNSLPDTLPLPDAPVEFRSNQ